MAALGPAAADGVDLIVTDSVVAGQRIDEQLGMLRDRHVFTPVSVVATYDTPVNRLAAIRAGARGYCARGEDPEAILAVLGQVAMGLPALPPEPDAHSSVPPPLTRREADVLVRLERGRQVKEVAVELGIADSTVRGYVREIFAKLDVHSVNAAVYEARVAGLLPSLHALLTPQN
jgi:NarL family two-component system response regulator YdfI